ncbi:hypothetical protein PVAP13_3KG538101 [Panicum virgatum]|uniref:Uncharacterized protein n=1 Tax=Panicum virgatum TaxID=38727 RepID=A0A8T0VCV4_PANVG|nr:hypothetical protein PVAP13_3KG538101 [Panicum virgatum]
MADERRCSCFRLCCALARRRSSSRSALLAAGDLCLLALCGLMPARIDLHLVALCWLASARILRRLGIQQRERESKRKTKSNRRRKEEAGPWMDEDERRWEEIRSGLY